MKTCIFGAGAVGGTLAVHLAIAGADVSVIVRGANLEAIRANGLVVKAEGEQDLYARPRAAQLAREIGVQDIVVVSVKLTSLPDAVVAAAPLIGPHTRILFAMNGLPWWFVDGLPINRSERLENLLDPSGQLRGAVPRERWVAGAVRSGNYILRPGVIFNTTPEMNAITLGYSDGRTDKVLAEFCSLAQRGSYRATVSPVIRDEIWSKLLINAALGAVSTITERTHKATCQDPATRALALAAMQEIIVIGNSIGLHVGTDPVALTNPETMPAHTTSFLQDLRAGRALEISNGILAVCEIARIQRVAAPHLDSLAALLAARSAVEQKQHRQNFLELTDHQ